MQNYLIYLLLNLIIILSLSRDSLSSVANAEKRIRIKLLNQSVPSSDSIDIFELVIYENDGKYGFSDADGEQIIPAQFTIAQDFSAFGIAAVVDDSGWVYINKKGEKLIRPFIIDNGPDYFSEGLARYVAGTDNKIGFFDESGNVVIAAQFDYAKPFLNGKAEVCNGGYFETIGEHTSVICEKWEYINKSGKVVSGNNK